MHQSLFIGSGKAMSLDALKEYSSLVFPRKDAGVLVKEVVSFSPPADPYQALSEASKRVAEGKSVFGNTMELVRAVA